MRTPVEELFDKLWECEKDKFTWNQIKREMMKWEMQVMCEFAYECNRKIPSTYEPYAKFYDQTFNIKKK